MATQARPILASEDRHKVLIETAQELTANTVPIMVIRAGLKRPHSPPGGDTWWIITDPDEVAGAFTTGTNIAITLGRDKESPVIGVGLDLYKDQTVAGRAKELGITSDRNTWIEHTGRGGITLIYQDPGIPLRRDTRQHGGALDLLVNGYTLIPPSDTSKEPQGGGPYRWAPGHSPFEIPLVDLDFPPKPLMDWWQELHREPQHRSHASNAGVDLPAKHQGPIPEGGRNEELVRRAGYLHRLIPDDGMVQDLVHAINARDCQPPLSAREVDAILNSILRRDGAGHFRGVQPAPLEVRT